MKLMTLAAALTIGLAPVAAISGNHSNGNGNGQANGRPFTEDGFCPPGLANRNPPCVPPGQAAKYGVGERIVEDYSILENPFDYGLDSDGTYYVYDGFVYQVDENTTEIINLIGAVDAILN